MQLSSHHSRSYQPRVEELDLARTKLLKLQLSSLSLLLQLSVQPPRLHITVLPILIQSQRPTPKRRAGATLSSSSRQCIKDYVREGLGLQMFPKCCHCWKGGVALPCCWIGVYWCIYRYCCWCILRMIWRGGGTNLIDCLHAIMRGLHRKAVLFVLEPDTRVS